jgi:hypothetical protein
VQYIHQVQHICSISSSGDIYRNNMFMLHSIVYQHDELVLHVQYV